MTAKQVITAFSVMFLLTSYAYAGQSGYYAGASSGVLLTKNSVDDSNGSSADLHFENVGIPASAFIGYQFGSGFRVEEELFYKEANATEFSYSGINENIDSKVWTIGAMSNMYYDFFHNVEGLSGGPMSHYMGVGVGLGNVNISEGSVNGLKLWDGGNDTVLVYQASIGTGIPIRKNLMLDVSYRFFGTTSIHINQIKTDFNTHNFLLGFRYSFGS